MIHPARRRALELEMERQHIRQQTFYDRLAFQHGAVRAHDILEGKDEATNADLAKWRGLGSGAAQKAVAG